ncbi:glycosyltransferase family 4 protein [Candidatus Kaiserbacteria bacterium]|nr:glycosyltransferase family 4 protein [Candidatus Kaiserbacteria bacterium]
MKIRYAVNARIPTHRAHGLQVMKTCEALVQAGADVELIVPKRPGTSPADPYAYYSVKPIFQITYLPTLEFFWRGYSRAFALQTLAFTLSLAWHLKRYVERDSVLYVRGELGWLLPLVSRAGFVWENHIKARRERSEARAVRRARGIVVVTKYYRDDLIRKYSLSPQSVLVAPDGVDLGQFGTAMNKREARTRLGLPQDKKLALYVGSDLPWKGLRYLREAGQFLPDEYEIVFVGSISSSDSGSNQRYVGLRQYEEIPVWLAAADALILTGDPASDTARHYTSPMKLFEYMAARRPIVASDLPSFRDVLSEETAVLVPPADPQALAEGIIRAVTGPDSQARVNAAREAVEQFSWPRRAERILAFIRNRES